MVGQGDAGVAALDAGNCQVRLRAFVRAFQGTACCV